MKAILNVKGTKLSVVGLNINEDKFTSVQVLDAEGKVTTHYDSKYAPYVPEGASVINLKEALEFPDANKEIVALYPSASSISNQQPIGRSSGSMPASARIPSMNLASPSAATSSKA